VPTVGEAADMLQQLVDGLRGHAKGKAPVARVYCFVCRDEVVTEPIMPVKVAHQTLDRKCGTCHSRFTADGYTFDVVRG